MDPIILSVSALKEFIIREKEYINIKENNNLWANVTLINQIFFLNCKIKRKNKYNTVK
jgi:hypothetical protein